MNISALLFHLDRDYFQSPPFANRVTWTDGQVISYLNSLYRGYPLGGFVLQSIASAKELRTSHHREMVIDGTQRFAAIYRSLRGRTPQFLAGTNPPLIPIYFDLDRDCFEVCDPDKTGNPLYISLVDFFAPKSFGVGQAMTDAYSASRDNKTFGDRVSRVLRLEGIANRNLYIEAMPTGASLEECQKIHDLANRIPTVS